MRVPRLTIRRWMGLVAVIGLAMGLLHATLVKRRRADYKARADVYAVHEQLARLVEQVSLEKAQEATEAAKREARHALRIVRVMKLFEKRSYAIPMPGTRDDALAEGLLDDLRSFDLQLAMRRADEEDRSAKSHRAEASAKAKEAVYYAKLRAKYEWAADHAWLPVAPDPPAPR